MVKFIRAVGTLEKDWKHSSSGYRSHSIGIVPHRHMAAAHLWLHIDRQSYQTRRSYWWHARLWTDESVLWPGMPCSYLAGICVHSLELNKLISELRYADNENRENATHTETHNHARTENRSFIVDKQKSSSTVPLISANASQWQAKVATCTSCPVGSTLHRYRTVGQNNLTRL